MPCALNAVPYDQPSIIHEHLHREQGAYDDMSDTLYAEEQISHFLFFQFRESGDDSLRDNEDVTWHNGFQIH